MARSSHRKSTVDQNCFYWSFPPLFSSLIGKFLSGKLRKRIKIKERKFSCVMIRFVGVGYFRLTELNFQNARRHTESVDFSLLSNREKKKCGERSPHESCVKQPIVCWYLIFCWRSSTHWLFNSFDVQRTTLGFFAFCNLPDDGKVQNSLSPRTNTSFSSFPTRHLFQSHPTDYLQKAAKKNRKSFRNEFFLSN